jgi:hypothetical protein
MMETTGNQTPKWKRQRGNGEKVKAGNGCRIAVRRRKGPAFGLALRAPLPRRAGMRRAGGVFPNNREDETPTNRSQPWPNFAA